MELVQTCPHDVLSHFQTCIASLLSILHESPGASQRRAPLSVSTAVLSRHARHHWSGASVTVQREHPHRDALLGKAMLPLPAQHHQPALLNEALQDIHVPSHTAVREI